MKPFLLFLGFALLTLTTYGQDDLIGGLTNDVDIAGLDTQWNPLTNTATVVGDVRIKYDDVEITAGRAEYNMETGDISARENVTVIRGTQIFRGENITYNINTNRLISNQLQSSMGPLFYDSQSFKTRTEDMERIDSGATVFTTHDTRNPNYTVSARSVTIYPGDRIILRNVKMKVGNVPVFYFPYIVQPLDDELGLFFMPGYTSDWGVFLLTQYGVMHGDHTLAKYHFDLRSTRGVGIGADYYSTRHRSNPHLGHLKLYYAYDLDPPIDRYSGPLAVGQEPDEIRDRYRIVFQHRIYVPGPAESTWYLDFDITHMSDSEMLKDYFLTDHRLDPRPDNHIKLVKRHDRFTATLLARMQLNEHYTTDTRLPELAFDFTRSPLWNTGIFYQGETSLGLYRDKLTEAQSYNIPRRIESVRNQLEHLDTLPNTPTVQVARDAAELTLNNLQNQLNEDRFFRAHSYHEFLYPTTFGSNDFVSFVPRIGGGATYYSDVEGGPVEIGSDVKPLFHAGFDLSMRFSRVWDQAKLRAIGVDQIRHIFQPYVNYSYLHADPIDGLFGIDRLAPTTRPRPIDVPLFTAIDGLSSWNVARVGMYNFLQTKRDQSTHNYLGLNTFIDVFFDDPEFDRRISNLVNDFYWNPLPWLALSIESQIPIDDNPNNFNELITNLNWMPTDFLRWTISHQLLSDNPIFVDSNRLQSRVFTRFNDNWGFSMNHVYEFDDSTMEYQSYNIHRDLASWSVSFGGLIRDNRDGERKKEYGLVLTFTLKDLPQVSFPFNIDPNPQGTGGSESN